jgi:hypothetical protein
MKKTLNIDEQLLIDAKRASGASTDTATIRLGLQALVRREAYERLRSLLGSEPGATDVPRRGVVSCMAGAQVGSTFTSSLRP